MRTKKLSDEEIHKLVIESIKSTTREEWQTKIDEVKAIFDRVEAEDRALANGRDRKPAKLAKKSSDRAPVPSGP